MALVETRVKGDKEVLVEGYKWFGYNRKHLHRKAVRGSSGVGVLVRVQVLKCYQVAILEGEVEHMLWAKLNQEAEEQGLVLALWYVPLELSNCKRSLGGYFQLLAEQVAQFGVFGDFSGGVVISMHDVRVDGKQCSPTNVQVLDMVNPLTLVDTFMYHNIINLKC